MTKLEIIEKLKEKNIQFNEEDGYTKLLNLLKSSKEEPTNVVTEKEEVKTKEQETIELLLAKVSELEKKDTEKDKQLQTLYAVADKGRLSHYEGSRTKGKPFLVKLSVYDGKLIVGWATKRDELIKNPTTGLTIGERQEIEVKLLDKEGQESIITFDSYVSFSNARYGERVEAEVVGKREDWQGNLTFDVKLGDGRQITLDSRFIN